MALALIEHGADVHVKFNGHSCLHASVWPEVIKALLKAGADLDIRAPCGNTPLAFMTARGKKQNVEILIYAGANVNNIDHEGDSPLHYASYYGHVDIVRVLLDKGADPFICNSRNMTVLWSAASKPNMAFYCNAWNVEIAKLILQRNVDVRVGSCGSTHVQGSSCVYPEPVPPLYVAMDCDNIELTQLLAEACCHLNGEVWKWEPDTRESNESHKEFLKIQKKNRVPSLRRVGVFFIRQCLGRNIESVSTLPLPKNLQDEILLKDLLFRPSTREVI